MSRYTTLTCPACGWTGWRHAVARQCPECGERLRQEQATKDREKREREELEREIPWPDN